MLGSRRGQLDTCTPIGSFQAWVFKAGYLWVLSLKTASWGAHTLGTFQKHTLFSPPSTTSDKVRQIINSSRLAFLGFVKMSESLRTQPRLTPELDNPA
jgi:hypothetical protein